MNKNKLCLYLIIYILLFILVSCKNNFEYNDSKQSILTANSDINNTNSPNYTIRQEVLTEFSNNNKISINYPQLISDERDFYKTNQLIKHTMENILKLKYGGNYENLTLNVDYRITLSNNSLLSVVFEGLSNVISAAHPINVFFTLNIDLINDVKLNIDDIITVDSELIRIYRDEWKKQSLSEISDYINDFKDDELKIWFKDEDEGEHCYIYLTDTQLGISLTVPHAMGDHVEILISYEEIGPNLKLKL